MSLDIFSKHNDPIASANELLQMTVSVGKTVTRVLGRGEHGITFETDDDRALKIVRYTTPTQRARLKGEVTYQKELAELDIAPYIYADEFAMNYLFIEMERVEPVTFANTSQRFIERLIRLIAKMVYHGYIHNDTHWGNIAKRGNEPLLIDLGFTQKLGYRPDRLVFNQILMAQLYALTDPCNRNNCREDELGCECLYKICDEDEPINTIYKLRQGDTAIYETLESGGIYKKRRRERFTRKVRRRRTRGRLR